MFTYIDEVNPNLICCICQSPFLNPVVTTTCSHTFCRGCIERSLGQQSCCPVDRSPLTLQDLRPENLLLRNMVDELIVECSNKHLGCLVTIQRHLSESHKRESCLFTLVPCAEEGCCEMLMRRDLGRHGEICLSREDECELCGTCVKAVDMKAHSTECLEQEISCSSCSASLKRSQIANHSLQCPKAAVKCDHSQYGCLWAGERQGLSAHIQTCSFESLKGFFHVVDRKFEIVRDENSILRQRLDNAESTIRSLQLDLAKVRKSLGRWCAPEDDAIDLSHIQADPNGTSTATNGFDIPRWRTSHPLTPLLSFSPEASPITPAREVTDAYNSSIGSNMALSDPSYLATFFPPASVSSSTNIVENEATNPAPLSSRTASTQPQIDSILAQHMRSQFPLAATRPSHAFSTPPIRFPEVATPRTNASNNSSSAVAGASYASTAHASRVSPLDNSTTLESALVAIQRSISSVSNAVDALSRRTDVALTMENLRMTEEVSALRAIVHGLRMQVHALLSDRNSMGGSGWAGLGSGSVMTTTTATYLNHPPPPNHTPLVINSSSTTSTTKL